MGYFGRKRATPLALDLTRARDVADDQSGRQRRFQLVTAVWGEWHTGVFLNFNIPSLLAPGNIPGLCSLQQGRYVIFTRRSDAERIAGSAAFSRLSRCLPVELIALHDKFFAGNP